MHCGAERQAMRHHGEGTGGAARHAGCSGQMRPCLTARRRRQGSVDQVRECTGPAMPQHTYTQRAHNTHSPARLPVPVGRHPGLCPLVTAPSAHHITSHDITAHQITSHHMISHHITPHHTTSHHITSHRTTSHHITSHDITSHHITSHHITSHHITSHHITSHHIKSHHTHHITSYYITSHPTTPWAGLPIPQAGVPGSTSPQALQDAPTTPWAGLHIPPGRCTRFYVPTSPARHSDHPLGRTPHPPGPVCPILPPRGPYKTLRPPPGQDSPSPQAGVPGPTSPQALQDTPTTDRCPLPPGSEAAHCKSSTAHCPQAVRQCIAEVALPTAPGQ